VTITTDFDKADPFSSTFLVSNDGYLPAYSVSVDCLLDVLSTEYADKPSSNPVSPNEMKGGLGTGFHNTELAITTLMPGTKETVPFSSCFPFRPGSNLKISAVHVGLRVNYRPLLWPWKRSVAQQLYAREVEGGRYIWYSTPYLK
jgi:hypothetical protein